MLKGKPESIHFNYCLIFNSFILYFLFVWKTLLNDSELGVRLEMEVQGDFSLFLQILHILGNLSSRGKRKHKTALIDFQVKWASFTGLDRKVLSALIAGMWETSFFIIQFLFTGSSQFNKELRYRQGNNWQVVRTRLYSTLSWP